MIFLDNTVYSLSTAPAPHIRGGDTTRSLYLDLLIALSPSVLVGVFSFGLRALLLMLIAALSAYIFNSAYGMLIRERHTGDLSPVATGLLLALTFPAGAPLWLPALGSLIAVVVLRRLAGGARGSIFNPALGARVALLLLFPLAMSAYCAPRSSLLWLSTADVVTTATPLTAYRLGIFSDLWSMFIGQTAGAIGSISAMAVLTGGVYLLIRRVISWQIPAGFIGAAALIALLSPNGFSPLYSAAHQLLAGGTLFCAFFMATDPATSPVTATGRLVFGAGCGALTMLIRSLGHYADGAGFAVLIMNALVWFIDLKLSALLSGAGKRLSGLIKRPRRARTAAKPAEREAENEQEA